MSERKLIWLNISMLLKALFDRGGQWLYQVLKSRWQKNLSSSLERFHRFPPDQLLPLPRDRSASDPAKTLSQNLWHVVPLTPAVTISFFTLCILPTNLAEISSHVLVALPKLRSIDFVKANFPCDIPCRSGVRHEIHEIRLCCNLGVFFGCPFHLNICKHIILLLHWVIAKRLLLPSDNLGYEKIGCLSLLLASTNCFLWLDDEHWTFGQKLMTSTSVAELPTSERGGDKSEEWSEDLREPPFPSLALSSNSIDLWKSLLYKHCSYYPQPCW